MWHSRRPIIIEPGTAAHTSCGSASLPAEPLLEKQSTDRIRIRIRIRILVGSTRPIASCHVTCQLRAQVHNCTRPYTRGQQQALERAKSTNSESGEKRELDWQSFVKFCNDSSMLCATTRITEISVLQFSLIGSDRGHKGPYAL